MVTIVLGLVLKVNFLFQKHISVNFKDITKDTEASVCDLQVPQVDP